MAKVGFASPRVSPANDRPQFKKRVVVTGGMPYGSKQLHFGHILGMYAHADCFSRFMRNRIGRENVLFISGTDCFGSPIVAKHQEITKSGEYSGSLQDFVLANHLGQKATLDAFGVKPDLFAASSLAPFTEVHREMGEYLMRKLHQNGWLIQRSTPQFYDAEFGFLNGRQVKGYCPTQGCKAENAWGDECDLGHTYDMAELLKPVSVITGKTPEMRQVTNWYINLPKMRRSVEPWFRNLVGNPAWRKTVVSNILESFEAPALNVNVEFREQLKGIIPNLAGVTVQEASGNEKIDRLVFENLEQLDAAKIVLQQHAIRFRSRKTLFPFRLTGNLEWGLPVVELDGLTKLTHWVWPESLWAPVSFTKYYLMNAGKDQDAWKEWWCSKDAQVYQFIGVDNVAFYSLPQTGILMGTQGREINMEPAEGEFQQTILVANNHIQFMGKKASSSSAVKPPMAQDLLQFYTPDVLRIHCLNLGLANNAVSFSPKALDPDKKNNAGFVDPVMKDGGLVTGALNGLVRSCFNTAQKYYDRKIPVKTVSESVLKAAEEAILKYEKAMATQDFLIAIDAVRVLVDVGNKKWTDSKPFAQTTSDAVRAQELADAVHVVMVATKLYEPFSPFGTNKIREYLGFGDDFFNWNMMFASIYDHMEEPNSHTIRGLAEREDFFDLMDWQIRKS